MMILAIISIFFALYSFGCYFLDKKRFNRFLKIIAIANTLYCVLTLGLIMFLHNTLTIYDFIYFIGEIIFVMTLVVLEWKLSNMLKPKKSLKVNYLCSHLNEQNEIYGST